jgi:nucleoside recognition membrane protein YjiH
MKNTKEIENKHLIKFILISLLGIIIFTAKIIPGSDKTILLFIIHGVQDLVADYFPHISLIFTFFAALFSIVVKFSKNSKITTYEFMKRNFKISYTQLIIRISAFLLSLLYILRNEIPLDTINQSSGELIVMCGSIIVFIIGANMFLPLLSDFGLAEFLEVLLTKFIKPLFKVPAYAVMSIITAFFVGSTMSMFLTGTQYEKGLYNKQEALKTMTALAVPSIPTCLLFWALFGDDSYFGTYYLMVVAVFFTVALILVRIPPLTTKSKEYLVPKKEEEIEKGNIFKRALTKASNKASKAKYKPSKNIKSVLSILLSFIPFLIALGTLSVYIINNFTIIDTLSYPFALYLKIFGIEEYIQAAPTFILNFVDLAMPAVILKNISSLETRLIMGTISINILLFIAPLLIITSFKKLTNIKELISIMFIRIILLVPITVLWAKLLI